MEKKYELSTLAQEELNFILSYKYLNKPVKITILHNTIHIQYYIHSLVNLNFVFQHWNIYVSSVVPNSLNSLLDNCTTAQEMSICTI